MITVGIRASERLPTTFFHLTIHPRNPPPLKRNATVSRYDLEKQSFT